MMRLLFIAYAFSIVSPLFALLLILILLPRWLSHVIALLAVGAFSVYLYLVDRLTRGRR